MYAGVVVFFDSRLPVEDRQLWWDLQYVHSWASNNGDAYLYKDWCKKMKRLVGGIEACNGALELRKADTAPDIVSSICTTLCLLLLLWQMADYTKSKALSDACIGCACTCAGRVAPALPATMRNVTVEMDGATFDLQVGPQGSVSGLRGMVEGGFRAVKWQTSLATTWNDMRNHGVLEVQEELLSDYHHITVVVKFFYVAESLAKARAQTYNV